METLKIEKEDGLFASRIATNYKAWLFVDGKAVAYARLMEQGSYNDYVCVCDIETREGYRSQGYAKKLLSMASAEMGKKMATTGSFTPEGFQAFYGKLHQLKGYGEGYDHPTFNSMNFVHDWEELYAM